MAICTNLSLTDDSMAKKRAGVRPLPVYCLWFHPKAVGTVASVSEDFVDDGDDVGNIEGTVVVHVALLG